jgi:hypothetical protein
MIWACRPISRIPAANVIGQSLHTAPQTAKDGLTVRILIQFVKTLVVLELKVLDSCRPLAKEYSKVLNFVIPYLIFIIHLEDK